MVGDGAGVVVAWPAIRRRLAANFREATWVIFRGHRQGESPPRGRARTAAMGPALAAAEEAVRVANAAVPEDTVESLTVSPSPVGPVIYLEQIDVDPLVQRWLGVVADTLTAGGWTGRIGPAPTPRWPRVLDERMPVPHLTAYLAYTMDRPVPRAKPGTDMSQVPPPRWYVDPDTAAVVAADMAEWVHTPDAEVAHLTQGISTIEVAGPVPAEILTTTAQHAQSASIGAIRSEPLLIRYASLGPYGEVVYQVDSHDDWTTRLHDLLAVTTGHPDRLDLAVIRRSVSWVNGWDSVSSSEPRPPGGQSWSSARPWWSWSVPDAYGVQVLTGQHLARARTLERWDVQPLTGDRYLVQHPDLDAWYATDTPDPDTLATARHDFGDMIPTHDAVIAARRAFEI